MQSHVSFIGDTDHSSLGLKAVVADKGFCGSEVVVLNLSEHMAFNKSCETFVEPDVLPVVGGNLVSGPLLRNFSHKHELLTTITDDSCL